MTYEETIWLAGLLEGEGWFSHGPPSAPTQCRVGVEMVDEDIISRVAGIVGITYIHKQQRQDWKPSYRVIVRGNKARQLMKAVYPWMGKRRKARIDEIL